MILPCAAGWWSWAGTWLGFTSPDLVQTSREKTMYVDITWLWVRLELWPELTSDLPVLDLSPHVFIFEVNWPVVSALFFLFSPAFLKDTEAALKRIIVVILVLPVTSRVCGLDYKCFPLCSLVSNFVIFFPWAFLNDELRCSGTPLPPLKSSGLGFPCFRKIRLGSAQWREEKRTTVVWVGGNPGLHWGEKPRDW